MFICQIVSEGEDDESTADRHHPAQAGKTIIELAEEKGYMTRDELEKVLDLRKLTEA